MFLTMVDGITTRQNEVLQLQKDVEKLDVKMDSTAAQLRVEMRLGMDILGMEMKKLFEQVLYNLDPIGKSVVIEGSGNSGNSDAKLKSKWGEE